MFISGSQRELLQEGIAANLDAVLVCVKQAAGGEKPLALVWSLLEQAKVDGWRATGRAAPHRGRGLSANEIAAMAVQLGTFDRARAWALGAGRRIQAEDRRVILEDDFAGLAASEYDELEQLAAEPIADAA